MFYSFLGWVACSLLTFNNSLYILGRSLLSDGCFANISLQSTAYHFILLTSIWQSRSFKFQWSSSYQSFFHGLCFWIFWFWWAGITVHIWLLKKKKNRFQVPAQDQSVPVQEPNSTPVSSFMAFFTPEMAGVVHTCMCVLANIQVCTYLWAVG